MKEAVLRRCRRVFPSWRGVPDEDFACADPKGFSSFTMAVRCRAPGADPPAALYRQLAGKENAILDAALEREVYLALADRGIAAACHVHEDDHRIEAFYEGRTLRREEVRDPDTLRKVAGELFHLHQLAPPGLPEAGFFELLHRKWGPLARRVLVLERDRFPPHERAMCRELTAIYTAETAERVQRCLPPGPMSFCHNDTYHGNVMKLDDGRIRLLDFEFSCRNHIAFDFANLFAETVMRHGLSDDPYFAIAEPDYTTEDIARLVDCYLANLDDPAERERRRDRLVGETRDMLMMSDYMYAMAAIPLAVAPIQKIRFIPYAHARFRRFLAAFRRRFP